VALVFRFLEHPSVELEPGQFAVEKAAGTEGGNTPAQFGPLDLLWQTHR
jgi:hypothetical protein